MFAMKFINVDLWRIWLLIFVTTLNIYLIYSTVRDYLSTKALSFDPLFGGDWNQGPMGFKLSCILCSLTLFPLIMLSSLIVTGNLANDGHILGQDIDNNHFIIDSDPKGQIILVDVYKSKKIRYRIFCGNFRFIKQQFIPISIFLQILSGFCYLIPLPFIEAQKLAHKALSSSFVWHTDLDFLINPDIEHEDFARGEPVHLPMRPAYFNLIFCFSLLSFRYPSVFWRTSRHFSLLFYFLIIVISIHILIDYSAMSILIRLLSPGYIPLELTPQMHPNTICFLSVCGSMILVMLLMTVFNYGITKYLGSLAQHRQQLRMHYKAREPDKSTDNEEGSNSSSDSINIDINESSENSSCLSIYNRYSVNIVAVMLGGLAMGMKVPLFVYQWRLYTKTGDRLMYMNIVVAIILSITWLITWFGFTLKTTWKFKVNFRSTNGGSTLKDHYASVGGITCSTLPTTSTKTLHRASIPGNTGSPVYATCHPTKSSPANTVIITPNHFSSNQLQSEDGCYNYVFLQSANAPSASNNQIHSNAANYATIIRPGTRAPDNGTFNFVNINGNLINAEDFQGSDKSSDSNLSRTLTAIERNRYAMLPQEIPDGILNRYLVNRFNSIDNPSTKRTPIVRSPLLSYQFSAESSPSMSGRRQLSNQSQNKVTFNDQFVGKEPDLINHDYPINTIVRLENLTGDCVLTPGPTPHMESNTHSDCGLTNQRDDGQGNHCHDFMIKLNSLDESNDEEERLCSQV